MELLVTAALIVIVASIVTVTIVAMLISFAVLAFEDLMYFVKDKFAKASDSYEELTAEEEAEIQAAADELGIGVSTNPHGKSDQLFQTEKDSSETFTSCIPYSEAPARFFCNGVAIDE